MKDLLWNAIESLDDDLLAEHVEKRDSPKDAAFGQQKKGIRPLRAALIAATAALLSAMLLFTLLFDRTPYAFMEHEGFYQINTGNRTDPAFRHAEDLVTPDELSPIPVTGTIPESITVNGETLAVKDCLLHQGATLLYGLDAEKYTIPFINDHTSPTVTVDALTGRVTGIENVAIDHSPGLGKTAEDYIGYARTAVLTYLPYLDCEGLRIKNYASMLDHSSPNAYGFILFDYYLGDIRTALRVSVFFGGGTIFSIGVYDYFDLSSLDGTPVIDREEHETLLTSFADYACGDMTEIQKTVSDGVLVMGAKGRYAMSYTMTLTAEDPDGKEHTQIFTLEIELD